ncbi:ABC transporter ATP-binding protein/permease (plasmid) [Lacticaseibacillus paracasei subsp. paracasei]|uniref:ATP-binding cassette domain-containing protein n=1 Tax=Lacticaseibacillus paracasei TaxID=1597 RepID=UPI001892A3DD|nr:ABC transporter ATP-binding protein [Lacticaseibacillus paracasei]QPC20544.1 ABC transporter ATP-binding protein [Lacticaseibacillus paracasei subsp. tolerans]UJS09225.1 ABC transporter ATP-binding protein/permease [Lacticaseibacillus paracasei subsp. paracasei]
MTIWKYGNRKLLVLLIPLLIISNLFGTLVGVVLSMFVKAATMKNIVYFFQAAVLCVLGVCSISIVSIVCVYVRSKFIYQTNLNIKGRMLQSIIHKESLDESRELSFMTNDLKLLETNGIEKEIEVLSYVFEFVSAFVVAIFFDWVTTLVFLICGLIPAVISSKLGGKISKASKEWSKSNANYTRRIKDLFAGIETIRVYNVFKIFYSKGFSESEKLESSLQTMNTRVGTIQQMMFGLTYLLTLLLPFGVGIYRVIQGASTLALFMGVMQLSNSITNPLMGMLSDWNLLQTTKGIREKVDGADPNKSVENISASQEFSGIIVSDATLKAGGRILFKHLNLDIKPNDKVLIMAPSGFGKSTLLRALVGEYPFSEGKYKLNGRDVTGETEFPTNIFSMIKQNPFLFNDTLVNNITLEQNFETEKLTRALDKADLTKLVRIKGFQYLVGDNGQDLSGGQAQRIEIARAFIRCRQVLLADEPTSALDENSSEIIQKNLLNYSGTLIQVSHKVPLEVQKKFTQVIQLDRTVPML